MTYREHPYYYVTQYIIGHLIRLANWLLLYIYTLRVYGGCELSATNVYHTAYATSETKQGYPVLVCTNGTSLAGTKTLKYA